MTQIIIVTKIDAPIEKVFNLSTSIDIHLQSAGKTSEVAIAGVTSGNIKLGESVTWKGRHFGIMLTHKSRITSFDFPRYFVDEMEKGCFKSFRHEHYFEFENGVTTMTDKLCYETPYGFLGEIFDRLLLKKHLTRFLIGRNQYIKESI